VCVCAGGVGPVATSLAGAMQRPGLAAAQHMPSSADEALMQSCSGACSQCKFGLAHVHPRQGARHSNVNRQCLSWMPRSIAARCVSCFLVAWHRQGPTLWRLVKGSHSMLRSTMQSYRHVKRPGIPGRAPACTQPMRGTVEALLVCALLPATPCAYAGYKCEM
jgi:hypothetical protein